MKIRLINENGSASQPVLYDRFLTLLWLAEVNGWWPSKKVIHEANRPLEDAFKNYGINAVVSEKDADQMVYALKMIRKTAPATITSGFQTTLNVLIAACDEGGFEIQAADGSFQPTTATSSKTTMTQPVLAGMN